MRENEMNEFEWRRQMRDLRQPLAPRQDLWASIDAALDNAKSDAADDAPTVPAQAGGRRRWLIAASVAASVLLAGVVGWHARNAPMATPVASATSTQNWKPADPRLVGAATQLNAARMELQQAMQQAPHSPALQRLLIQTERQQSQLRQLASDAG
jgi:hypothetical protein